MSLMQRYCHVKSGRAKIPGISSQADPLLCHRREHSPLKTLLFLLCCSKDFLGGKKKLFTLLFVHSSMASSPGCQQPLPTIPLPQHLQMPNRGCTITSLYLWFWIRILLFLSWKLPSVFVSQNKTCTRYCMTSQRTPHHCFWSFWGCALPPTPLYPPASSLPQQGLPWPPGSVHQKQHLSKKTHCIHPFNTLSLGSFRAEVMHRKQSPREPHISSVSNGLAWTW